MAEKKKFSGKEMMARIKKFWKGPLTPNYYLSLKEVAAFGVSGMGINFILNIGYLILNATIIPIAYGVEAIHATIITVVVSVLSLIISPIYGKIIDGTKTKKGNKIKPHFLWMTPAITIFAILASFSPQINSMTGKLIYLYCTAVPMLLLQSLFLTTFNLYPAVMTPNSQERSNMLSPVSIVYSFAPTIMNVLLGPIRDFFKNEVGKEYLAFRLFGIVFALLGCALTFLIFKFTKERTYNTAKDSDAEGTAPKIGFGKSLKMIAKNKPLILYIIFSIFTVLKTTFFLQAQLVGEYKYQADFGTTVYYSLTLITGFGATPGMLLAPILVKKVGKKNLLLIGTGIQTAILVMLALIGFQNMTIPAVTIVICTLYGFLYNICTGLNIIVFPSIMADLIDYQQYISDVRIEGVLNAANMWVSALFGVAFQFIPVLIQTKVIGFEQGLAVFRPSPASIANGVFNPAYVVDIADQWFNASVYIALIACVLSMIPLFFYTFNEKKHKQCMEEIKLRAVSSSFEDEESLAAAKEEAREELAEEGIVIDAAEIVNAPEAPVVEANADAVEVAEDAKTEEVVKDAKAEEVVEDVNAEEVVEDVKADAVADDEVSKDDVK